MNSGEERMRCQWALCVSAVFLPGPKHFPVRITPSPHSLSFSASSSSSSNLSYLKKQITVISFLIPHLFQQFLLSAIRHQLAQNPRIMIHSLPYTSRGCLLWVICVSEIRLSFFFFDVDANRIIINSKGNNECLQCWYLRSGREDFCKCKCHLRSQNEEGTFSYFYTRCRWAAPRFSMINCTCLFLFQSKWLQRLKKRAVNIAI